MKWIVVLALVGLLFIAYFGTPDVDLNRSAFTLDFDSAAMTEQLRIREESETQRLLIQELAETQRQQNLLVIVQIAEFIGALAIVAFVAYKLLRLLIERRRGNAADYVVVPRERLPESAPAYTTPKIEAAPEEMPDDVRRQYIIVLSQSGEDGYADVDGDDWVYVQPRTRTLITLGKAAPDRQLPGPAPRR